MKGRRRGRMEGRSRSRWTRPLLKLGGESLLDVQKRSWIQETEFRIQMFIFVARPNRQKCLTSLGIKRLTIPALLISDFLKSPPNHLITKPVMSPLKVNKFVFRTTFSPLLLLLLHSPYLITLPSLSNNPCNPLCFLSFPAHHDPAFRWLSQRQ